MIFGRPITLFVAVFSTVLNLIVLVLAALVPPIIIPAIIVGAANSTVLAILAIIANAPATVSQGSAVKVVTPKGQDNYQITA